MKIYIILTLCFSFMFPAFASDIDNKGLECIYNMDNQKPNEYYWFSEEQVYKVWYDKNKSLVRKSAYPAYYKQTEEYIRFFRIFVLLNTLEFTDKDGNILGACAFTKNYENIEEIIKNRLN